MLKRAFLYALAFAAVGVAYPFAKTMWSEDGASVDIALVITMAVTGALGGALRARRQPKE